jgi:hypothetical protein
MSPLCNDITQADPDAELDPLLRSSSLIALNHSRPNPDGAPNCIDDARELGQEALAGVLHNPASVLGNIRLDQLPEVRL